MFDSVFDKHNFNCTICFINSKIIDLKSQIYYLVNSLISFFFFYHCRNFCLSSEIYTATSDQSFLRQDFRKNSDSNIAWSVELVGFAVFHSAGCMHGVCGHASRYTRNRAISSTRWKRSMLLWQAIRALRDRARRARRSVAYVAAIYANSSRNPASCLTTPSSQKQSVSASIRW